MDVEVDLGSERLVHLDLKRTPIKVQYFEKIFPLFKSWGATGILIEWEDTFPYSGELAMVGSLGTVTKAYTEADVDHIHFLAEQHNLSVIPLVQTFGHLEFVLRHQEWSEVEEVMGSPCALCPSHPKALPLVTALIDQVAAKCPQSTKFFHIGADEVWHLGVCGVCSEQDRDLVLLGHLQSVLSHLASAHPSLRPIMWDDMLRTVDQRLLSEFGLGELVEPMVWIYEPPPAFHLPEGVWEKYNSVFKNVWIASAFKGATGSNQSLPPVEHHVGNHMAWLRHLTTHPLKPPTALRGIAITGWSRYDHYAGLCELLPCGLPSLALCLGLWHNRGYSPKVHADVAASLGYPADAPRVGRQEDRGARLDFPGWRITVGVEWLNNLKAKHHSIVESDQTTSWLSAWHIKHKFSSPLQIQGLVTALTELVKEWEAVETYMKEYLAELYFDEVIEEFLITRVRPLKHNAVFLHRSGEKLLLAFRNQLPDTQPEIKQLELSAQDTMKD